MQSSIPSFDNTKIAFEYKNNTQLKKARFLFSAMRNNFLVRMGTSIVPKLMTMGFPIKGILRSTIFEQFVGGETLEATKPAIARLGDFGVKAILDYGVEGGDSSETDFDQSMEQFLGVIDYAASQANIPYMSIKITGISRFALLEKMDAGMNAGTGTLVKRFHQAFSALTVNEQQEWNRIVTRIRTLCERAAQKGVGVLIDAEETWIQDPLDALTMLMMDEFNKNKLVIYNTLQHYRKDRLQFLYDSYEAAVERKFLLGIKLVRGAYMEKERERAIEKAYPSPIHDTKENCDAHFNESVSFCINHMEHIAVLICTHNEKSNLLATEIMASKGIEANHPHIHFSQLYGMSDNITFNLAQAGYSVSKYMPFGPIADVIPYLMRRAKENTSVKGQTGRELSLIDKEIVRRKKETH